MLQHKHAPHSVLDAVPLQAADWVEYALTIDEVEDGFLHTPEPRMSFFQLVWTSSLQHHSQNFMGRTGCVQHTA